MRIVYSTESIEDLERLREFINEHDPVAANRVAMNLISKIEQLAQFPSLGVAVDHPDAPDNMRQLVIQKYIVRYQFFDDLILILKVWHHKEARNL